MNSSMMPIFHGYQSQETRQLVVQKEFLTLMSEFENLFWYFLNKQRVSTKGKEMMTFWGLPLKWVLVFSIVVNVPVDYTTYITSGLTNLMLAVSHSFKMEIVFPLMIRFYFPVLNVMECG